MTPTAINAPIRIGQVTVLPGDVLFANDYGVVFIPAHLVDKLVADAEFVRLRDEFERVLLQQNKYPGGEIHGDWSDKIKNEFRTWLSKYPKKRLLTNQEIEEYLKKN